MGKTYEVEVFRTGSQTDSSGETRLWTIADLDKMVTEYNSRDEADLAPVVLGHPDTDSPAYGWVGKLVRHGEKLVATLTGLKDEFVQWIKDGHYKNRSISLNPETFSLNHVGFLGGVAPAIKGLAVPKFNGVAGITIEFSAAADTVQQKVNVSATTPEIPVIDFKQIIKIKNMFKNKTERTTMIPNRSNFSYDDFLKAVSAELTSALSNDVATKALEVIASKADLLKDIEDDKEGKAPAVKKEEEPGDEFAKAPKEIEKDKKAIKCSEDVTKSEQYLSLQTQVAELAKANEAMRAEAARQSKLFCEMRDKAKRAEFENYFNSLLSNNRVLPKQKELLWQAFEVAGKSTMEFSEGKETPQTVIQKLVESFSGYNPISVQNFADEGASADDFEAIRNFAKERNKA